MADKKLSGAHNPSLSSSWQNGTIGLPKPGYSPPSHHKSSLGSSTSSMTLSSTPPLRTIRTLGGLVRSGPHPGQEGSFTQPQAQSLSSALSSRMRTTSSKIKCQSNQQEEPEALLDLILECQGQRLEDQRASLNLLPDLGPAGVCGACSPGSPNLPTLDFYCMLIKYQSDRMEDQRCSLPDLDSVLGVGAEGQEEFLSLVQRVQSRRMDEQRASLRTHRAGSSHPHPHPHHHHHH